MTSNPSYRYSRLPDDPNNEDFVSSTLQKQQLIMDEQDEDLGLVSGAVTTLKHMSFRIGDELEEQSQMLGDLGTDMDKTENKLDAVMKKVAKLSHMDDDARQWKAIFVLIGLIIFLFMLIIVL